MFNTTTAPAVLSNEELLVELATYAAVASAYMQNGKDASHMASWDRYHALDQEAEDRGLTETHWEAYDAAIAGNLAETVAHLNG